MQGDAIDGRNNRSGMRNGGGGGGQKVRMGEVDGMLVHTSNDHSVYVSFVLRYMKNINATVIEQRMGK